MRLFADADVKRRVLGSIGEVMAPRFGKRQRKFSARSAARNRFAARCRRTPPCGYTSQNVGRTSQVVGEPHRLVVGRTSQVVRRTPEAVRRTKQVVRMNPQLAPAPATTLRQPRKKRQAHSNSPGAPIHPKTPFAVRRAGPGDGYRRELDLNWPPTWATPRRAPRYESWISTGRRPGLHRGVLRDIRLLLQTERRVLPLRGWSPVECAFEKPGVGGRASVDSVQVQSFADLADPSCAASTFRNFPPARRPPLASEPTPASRPNFAAAVVDPL
jgi:hypothetical protein